MIKHIQFNTKLSVSKYRRLVKEKPWLGKWDEVSLKDIKDDIRAQLVSNQDCCAYCGLPFKGNKDMQIEHIAPKAKYRYPQFTFTLENLVLSCMYCNDLIVKGTKDTIIAPSSNQYRKCNFSIVHPYFDNPEDHYDWTDNTIEVLIQVKNNSLKAHNSIKMFDLDSQYMSELRGAITIRKKLKNEMPLTNDDEILITKVLNYKTI